MADITMPQLGETVTEGTITKWFKQVGDEVAADEVLFEVSTDKVDSEVPSPETGYLVEILVQEGETVDVGTKLAVIGDSPDGGGGGGGEAAAAAPADQGGEGAPASEPQAPAEEAAAPAGQQSGAPGGDEAAEGGAPADARDRQAAEAQPAQADPAQAGAQPEAGGETVEQTADAAAGGDQPSAADAGVQAAPSGAGGDAPGGGTGARHLLSPVVRRLISEHDLDPDQIEGTGAGGRITRNDVLAVVEGGAPSRKPDQQPAAKPEQPAQERPAADRQPAAQQQPAPQRAPAPAPAAKAGERDEVVPFNNIRKRTAEHMVRSKATSAHTLVVIEVDYAAVDRVRAAAKEDFRAAEGTSLTYLPFIARAIVDAVAEFPHVNATVGDGELIVHGDVNLGIAVDLDFQGLMVPVVRGADGKRLRAIAREIADLAQRARTKQLSPDDITGGTFTITNPGPFGTLVTAPIINQPQVAILSTDGVKKRPVVVEQDGQDAIAIHPVGNLALSFDHRAFDGAYASAFLAKMREILETRDWSVEL